MKKLLTEERLCELAGITEADTEELWKTKRDAAKRQRHAAEKDFFGSDGDPLVTTDVPEIPQGDPDATHKLSPAALAQIEKDVPNEARRPVAMELYKKLIAPHYTEDQIAALVKDHPEVHEALSDLIGWFHPAFEDSGGMPTHDNPSRLGIKVAQEFEKEGLDVVDDAEEFTSRKEKYMVADARKEMEPDRNAQATRLAHSKALDAVLSRARENPKYKDLPPHQHFTGKELEKYADQLKQVFPDVYQDIYEKELEAMLS
jgi:hypothetical protein